MPKMSGTRYFLHDGLPCRVHLDADLNLTADKYYAEGAVKIDPVMLFGEFVSITRQRYDQLAAEQRRMYREIYPRVRVPKPKPRTSPRESVPITFPENIKDYYSWRGRPAVLFEENGDERAAVFEPPDKFVPINPWELHESDDSQRVPDLSWQWTVLLDQTDYLDDKEEEAARASRKKAS